MNFNFHSSLDENPHRLLNILWRDTYITPHRHSNPPKCETFLILEGAAKVVLFHDDGTPDSVHHLSAPSRGDVWGIDLAPALWHTIVAVSECAVCFEVKPGPWEATTDKDFAPWAPRENAEGWKEYLAWLHTL